LLRLTTNVKSRINQLDDDCIELLLHAQRWVVCIAMWPRRKEGASVRHIERRMAGKPRRQVGIRDEELSEGYGVRLSVRDNLVRLRQRVFFICDEYAAELLLELRSQSVGSEILAREQEAEFAPTQFTRHVTEGFRLV